jgi:hypothetical protein
MDVDDLLRILLVLVIVWVALEVVTELFEFLLGPLFGLLSLLKPVIGLVVLALIVLWLVDRI